ncbi:unnamed protein product [Protopolystoma xenopodis]|uniref:Uncharacterized protein n=1 Tax=Protopolystoma xenopodis TaxID=117903 RepID=A0A3S5BC68_9PLAT|nr:unnamed protein product [Protopolystoma xenopodis]
MADPQGSDTKTLVVRGYLYFVHRPVRLLLAFMNTPHLIVTTWVGAYHSTRAITPGEAKWPVGTGKNDAWLASACLWREQLLMAGRIAGPV